ncbi:unnamed protein product [Chironomus riparius]|uniref:F-box domain-containing protein n=1 Tax=Chironomus riparius TaxID=315576 RepID=A0A9N9RQ75_9DIPT|nr:unnamed protein product [Chironomus riparius]
MTVVCQLFSLPDEILIKVILMSEIKDIKNCMLASKELRNFIFNTPEIMRKVQINLKPSFNEWVEASTFLKDRGSALKNLKFKLFDLPRPLIKFILEQTPNLEELILVHTQPTVKQVPDEMDEQIDDNLPELPKLKALELELCDLRDFLKNIKSIKTLEKFTVSSKSYEDPKLLMRFLNQQPNLKELTMNATKENEYVKFIKYFSSKANFQLRTFKLKLCSYRNERYIVDFLKTQTECLEELEFNEEPEKDVLQLIFGQFRKLRKFSILKTGYRPILFKKSFPPNLIATLTYFEGDYFVDLHQLITKFPNIATLKCKKLKADGGNYDKITTLEVKFLDLEIFMNVTFPNLKNFSVTKNIKNCFNTDSCEAWKKFAKNIENVENITVKYAGDRYEFSDIDFFKGLKIFHNLQTFSYRHMLYGQLSDKPVSENEKIKEDNFYLKVLIDGNKKTVKVSNFLVDRYKGALKVLFDTFQGYEFIEFCFEDIWERPLNYKTAMTYYLTRNNKRPTEYNGKSLNRKVKSIRNY